MAFHVIDSDERKVASPSRGLGEGVADQESTHETMRKIVEAEKQLLKNRT